MSNLEKPQETLLSLVGCLANFAPSEGWQSAPIWFKDKSGKVYPVSTIGMTICTECPDDTPEEYKVPVGFVLQEASK
jgi:hypothetical protein